MAFKVGRSVRVRACRRQMPVCMATTLLASVTSSWADAPPRAMVAGIGRAASAGRGRRELGGVESADDDVVDDPVLLRLLGIEDEVAIGVAADLLRGLARVVRQQL